MRTTAFHYHGDVPIDPIRWTFFNPKIGARYDLTDRSGAYSSVGLSTREPTRNDLFQGEDNATIPHDLHAVRPERVLDVEAGWDYRMHGAKIAANFYAMEFRHEIAATGELSDIGLPLRRNVDRSYRRGFELDATWHLTRQLRLRNSASFSRNRIHTWLQFSNVNPLLTPTVIVSQSVEYTPSSRVSAAATGRYVSKSFLDNTNNDALTTPSLFDLDGSVAFSIWHSARLSVQLNNILNNKRLFASGYTDGVVAYYYPQATRNAVVMVDWKL
jgi:iron complex outermembrane recepter protein